jgi:hypothetical protein
MKQLYLIILLLFAVTSFNADAQNQAAKPDSITIAAHPRYNKVNGVHKVFFGKNYRSIWAIPVKMQVLHLDKEQGGLSITDIGGGNQTRSLQLKDSAGHEWALRTIQKYPGRALPDYLKKTIAEDILQDQVSTSHPYAALTVPPMADALGISHTNPKIVYLGDDPGLGKYRKDFANQVYLFEERQPLDGTKTDKTEKVQKKLEEDNDNRVDQKLLLRARLLDMIIGDWDRHGDQWRWEKQKDSVGQDIYEPSPRDRDKVFYATSGLFPSVLAFIRPQLQAFKGHIRMPDMWNFNARFFDRYFLNSLSEADWQEQIAYVQTHLTNQVITGAVKLLPANVYAVSGKKLTDIVIARRNHIQVDAINYYKFLSKNVDIPASDKREQFTIDELHDGKITVTINQIKKDDIRKVIYQRTFDPEVTKSVRLFSLDGNDVFVVKGALPSPIKVHMIGGDGKDVFKIDSTLHNRRKLYVHEQPGTKAVLPSSSQAHIDITTDTTVNKFNRESFDYDYYLPVLSLGYNTEDATKILAGFTIIKHGFGKAPYAYRQDLQVGYTLSRQSFIFTYAGDFKKVFGESNLKINILSRGPKNVNSFFGLGNDTPFPNEGTRKFTYYRNRYDYSAADIRIYHDYNKWQVSGGVIGQLYTSAAVNNQNLFFGEYNATHPDANLFATKVYAGLVAGVKYDTRNSTVYPTKGVLWNTNITGLTGVNINGRNNGQILSVFSFYLNPGGDSTLVIANRTGAGRFAGSGEFFQQMNLGGPLSLQGFHTSRFIGNTVLYNNLELRLKLFDWQNYLLPSTFGVVAFNDAGRVWLPGEHSDTWHDTYGGGVFIIPFHAFIFQAVMGKSPDGALLYLSSGFRF